MEIAPNSTIILLSGVPLDNTYTDTIYFSTEALQRTWFQSGGAGSGVTRKTYTAQSYQRIRKGVARIDVKADDIYNVNYMAFQNTSYGSKWFYAFVTDVEFVNNTTSDVFFELDVIQSFLFDFQLEPCFVEREIPASDLVGEHTYPEDLPVGEIICHDMFVPNAFRPLSSDLRPCICMSELES